MTANLLKLDDLRGMNSPEAIANVFKRLGYNKVGCPVDVSYLDVSAPNAKAVYEAHLIADQDNGELQVLLLQLQPSEWETSSTASTRMKAIATQVSGKPTEFLLLATKDYNQLMLVNPRKTVDDKQNVKVNIRKLLIDRTNPTNYDRERLESLAVNGKSPKELYKTHCEEFDVEKLTKSFYKGYKELFERVQAAVRQYNPDPYFDDADRLHQFSQRLLGRIMFLYFLQKKEFLAGDRQFLTKQYNNYWEENEFDYYQTVLYPLFFDTLNKQRPNFDSQWGKIPYLNGGLFDRDYGPDIRDTAGRETPKAIILPNSLFNPNNNESILAYFNRYNFTVSENVAGDEDIAVDPEMLGKVFENMLADEERGKSGTFYTPRGIVHFMCSEVLARYLADETDMKLEDIQKLIDYDPDITDPEIRELINLQQAQSLQQAIENIKVLDPAVGSGAFPLGMMQLLLTVQQVVARREGVTIQRGSPEIGKWKRKIIANNLYGVDIKPEAIEIAKLRMWLSLVVDIPRIEDVEPLPNLDYKLMCGNSLISTIHGEQLIPDPNKDKLQLEINVTPIQKAIQPLLELQHKYFGAQSEERHELRKQILEAEANVFREAVGHRRNFWLGKQTELEQKIKLMKGKVSKAQEKEQSEIIAKLVELDKFAQEVESGERSLNFFQYHLHFRDVFDKKGGFDCVIGNPPYVKEDVARSAFEGIKNSSYYQGKMDLWYFFGCRGIDLLKKQGLLCFIATNNWHTNEGASIFRNKITTETKLELWVDFGNYKVFESADIQTMILIVSTNKIHNEYLFDLRKIISENSTFDDVIDILNSKKTVNNTILNPRFNRKFFENKYIVFSSEENEPILNKMSSYADFHLSDSEVSSGIDVLQDFVNRNSQKKLGDHYKVGDGVFILSCKEKYNLNLLAQEEEIIKPFYTTKELGRYYGNSANKFWLIYTDSSFKNVNKMENYPNIKRHLDQFSEIMTSVNRPYGLHRSREQNLFVGEKILSVRKCAKPIFTYTNFDCYVARVFCIIKSERINLKYLTGLLNSRIIYFWLKNKGKLQGHQLQIDKKPLLSIPIIQSKLDFQEQITKLVDKIVTAKQSNFDADTSKFETEIDNLIYQLYKLTKEEIAIVENST